MIFIELPPVAGRGDCTHAALRALLAVDRPRSGGSSAWAGSVPHRPTHPNSRQRVAAPFAPGLQSGCPGLPRGWHRPAVATTERYLHSLPAADETALDALSRIRGTGQPRPG